MEKVFMVVGYLGIACCFVAVLVGWLAAGEEVQDGDRGEEESAEGRPGGEDRS